jgi:hypothetical protein
MKLPQRPHPPTALPDLEITDFAQGYLFSQPIPADDVPSLVEATLAGMLAG